MTRAIVLAGVLGVISGAIYLLENQRAGVLPVIQSVSVADGTATKKAQLEPAQELVAIDGYINTNPFTIQNLIGEKIILLDFWTYSCINCQRTIPYLRAWHEKYASDGLVIIGVHTPEFAFEKKMENVQRAVDQFGIQYPVVLDNNYGTWQAYGNRYWPRKYLIDIDGYVVYDHIGEGEYNQTEQAIQRALQERADRLGIASLFDTRLSTPTSTESVVRGNPYSPEVYFGASRNTLLSNGIAGKLGAQDFVRPVLTATNRLYLVGKWQLFAEYAQAEVGASFVFPYQAQKVFMVARADSPVRAKILLDGKPITRSFAGENVADGVVILQPDQLYRIIADDTWSEHTLEVIFLDPGAQIFTLTFG